VQCGGVSVQPGDLIVADANGVLVLRPQEAAAVAQEALARQESEKKLLAELKAGKDLPALTRANSLIAEKGFKKS
jgi:regulator of RNase E activity RraA